MKPNKKAINEGHQPGKEEKGYQPKKDQKTGGHQPKKVAKKTKPPGKE